MGVIDRVLGDFLRPYYVAMEAYSIRYDAMKPVPTVSIYLHRNVPGVYIKDLIPGSVASLDGQLRIDDRILEVNSDDLSILSQEHAANHIQV